MKKPRINIKFDSSLGYPEEGPNITFASANIRGSVNNNKFYNSVKLMLNDKIDVVALQELNVHRQNQKVIESHKHTAHHQSATTDNRNRNVDLTTHAIGRMHSIVNRLIVGAGLYPLNYSNTAKGTSA
eukprot:3884428-Pleurochrysis_carterae.AAC.1